VTDNSPKAGTWEALVLDGTSMESGWPPLDALLPGYVTGKGYDTGVGSWAGGTGSGDDGLPGADGEPDRSGLGTANGYDANPPGPA
jgi:hypothetical protein